MLIRLCALRVTVAIMSVWVSLAPAQRVAVVDADILTERALEAAPKEDRPEQLQKLQSDIQNRVAQIRDVEAELRRADGVLNTENLDRKRKEVTRLRNEIDDLEQKGRREIQRLNDLVFEPILKRVRWAIEDVAMEKQIDLVIPMDRALYISPKMTDITDDVVSRLRLSGTNRETTVTTNAGKALPSPYDSSNRQPSGGQRTVRSPRSTESGAVGRPRTP